VNWIVEDANWFLHGWAAYVRLGKGAALLVPGLT